MSERETTDDRADGAQGARRRDADGLDGDRSDDADRDPAALAAQVDLLAEENRRLRAEYARARRARYRRTATGLALIGAIAVLVGLALPAGREVLFVLGATGLFGGLLTYYLTPERFVAASVGERVYAAHASNHAALVDELGLRRERRYLPGADGVGPRVYVPQHARADVPTGETGPIVTAESSRGLLLEPTGAGLHEAFEESAADTDAASPAALVPQLADAVVEQFELARSVEPDVDADRITFAVADAAFGPLDRFDHPIPSLLAVGLAVGLDRPIELAVDPGDDRADWLVTCRWAGSEETSATADAEEPGS